MRAAKGKKMWSTSLGMMAFLPGKLEQNSWIRREKSDRREHDRQGTKRVWIEMWIQNEAV